MPQRALVRKLAALGGADPGMIIVCWKDDASTAAMEMAIPFAGMAAAIRGA
jgi:hypothetical protein